MIRSALSVAALCGTLLNANTNLNAPSTAELGQWSYQCQTNGEFCRVGQYVVSASDPDEMWVKVRIYREDSGYVMILLTPPLAEARVRLTLDRNIQRGIEATECDEDQCYFAERWTDQELKYYLAARELSVKASVKAGESISLPIDIRQLGEALRLLR